MSTATAAGPRPAARVATAAANVAAAREAADQRAFDSLRGLLLWLVGLGVVPLHAMAAAGLTPAMLAQLEAECAEDLALLRQLDLAGSVLARRHIGRLVRARVAMFTLTASTPAELAHVARAVKTLPDWVWDDPHMASDSTAASGAAPDAGCDVSEHVEGNARTGLSSYGFPVTPLLNPDSTAQLNRHQRRRLEKLSR